MEAEPPSIIQMHQVKRHKAELELFWIYDHTLSFLDIYRPGEKAADS